MKHKKRDREMYQEGKIDLDRVTDDYELFLRVFEKPTQIYRYLRTRYFVLPTFLHRCLSFMKKRSSRKNKHRLTFSIDSMLRDAETKQKLSMSETYQPDCLNIGFTEFCPNEVESVKGPVNVEISLLKLCSIRRKDFISHRSGLGVASVPLCGDRLVSSQSKVISVSIEHFSATQVPGVCLHGGNEMSYILSFRATYQQYKAPIGCMQDERATKRTRISSALPARYTRNYAAELVVYDKHGRCLLADGNYELKLCEETAVVIMSQTPRVKWETVIGNKTCGSFEMVKHQPTLKFRIRWSRMTGRASSVICTAGQSDHGIGINNSTVLQEFTVQDTRDITNVINQRVYYQFSYNSYMRRQTEARFDYRCPWCMINCMELYALLKHLRLSHARFNFSFTPSPVGACIEVSVNEFYDGGYIGNPQDTQSHLGYAYCRHRPLQRTPLTHVLVARPKRPTPSLSEFTREEDDEFCQNKQIHGHDRLYYHTVTNRPIKPNEIDEDSEVENDPEWLREKTVMMINEFTDVNDGEKEILKMWNLHVMKHNYIGDCQLTAACHRFIEKNGRSIIDKNLHRNLVAHLVNLNDTGLISLDTVLHCTLLLYGMETKID